MSWSVLAGLGGNIELPRDLVAWQKWWYGNFVSESLYRTYHCIPKDESIYFKIPSKSIEDGNVMSGYTIAVDGVILEDRDCRKEIYLYGRLD